MGVMVQSVTNLSRSGLSDWLIQRISAVILAAFTVFLAVFILVNPDLSYSKWNALFDLTWVKIFTLITVLSVVGHAWVGLWTVATDYIKAALIRFIFLCVVGTTLFVYLIITATALWG